MVRTLLETRDSLTLLPHFVIDRPGSDIVPLAGTFEEGALEAGLIYRRDSFHAVPAYSLLEAFRQGAAAIG